MKIEQIYTGCLAEAAYYIESEGEAVIIDPLRENKPYLERAAADHAQIKYILETHFHADFVSGHLDLALKTGATIVFGPTARPAYTAHVAADGEVLPVGKIKIKVLHTPGHTLESTTYLLLDEQDQPHAIFTGDTLFVGDVGRPDLVQKVKADITPEYLAGLLFNSLRTKIMTLPDHVIVYPGHGAGSACGKKMDKATSSTVGQQKRFNYALRADMTQAEFITEVLDGLTDPPHYFPGNVLLNVNGYPHVDDVLARGLTPLSATEFEDIWKVNAALVIDARTVHDFPKGFIPGSIFIGIDDTFAPWVGTLVPNLMQPILIVCHPGREEEVVTRLARVGYDHTLGFLSGGFDAWRAAGKAVDLLEEVTAPEFADRFTRNPALHVLDVRRASEYKSEHLIGTPNFPLDHFNKNVHLLDPKKKYYLHCAGGYRSLIMASLLRSRGFPAVVNVKGGYNALRATRLATTEPVAVNTDL